MPEATQLAGLVTEWRSLHQSRCGSRCHLHRGPAVDRRPDPRWPRV